MGHRTNCDCECSCTMCPLADDVDDLRTQLSAALVRAEDDSTRLAAELSDARLDLDHYRQQDDTACTGCPEVRRRDAELATERRRVAGLADVVRCRDCALSYESYKPERRTCGHNPRCEVTHDGNHYCGYGRARDQRHDGDGK